MPCVDEATVPRAITGIHSIYSFHLENSNLKKKNTIELLLFIYEYEHVASQNSIYLILN